MAAQLREFKERALPFAKRYHDACPGAVRFDFDANRRPDDVPSNGWRDVLTTEIDSEAKCQ